MKRVIDPLLQMGARLEGCPAGASDERYPPLTVHGTHPLRSIRYEMLLASAQVKSAILLAGVFADGDTTVVEPHVTRDHTERMLRHFGLRVSHAGGIVTLQPGGLVSPGRLVIPGDFSSAAFFIVAASCVPGSRLTLRGVSLNPTRTALLDVLTRMGAQVRCTIEEDAWEPSGTVEVEARPLRGITLEADEVPRLIDELPVLMVAATCAQGTTVLRGVGELRVKETDRIQSMVRGLDRLGARIRVCAPQTVEIHGGPLQGGEVESAFDHRTAMSLAVAGLMSRGAPTRLRGAECVAKSFPDFFDRLGIVAGSSTVKTVDKP